MRIYAFSERQTDAIKAAVEQRLNSIRGYYLSEEDILKEIAKKNLMKNFS